VKTTTMVALALAAVLAGCTKQADDSPMAGMSAEEHARMQSGGTQGAMDSTGLALRQPVHLTAAQERALGVTYVRAERDTMTRVIRTVGQIVAAESAITDITPKFDGFVERLFVNFTGQLVHKGEPLLAIYSPMLVAAQEELLTAERLAAQTAPNGGESAQNGQAMLEAARRRLAYWDISSDQIARIERTGEVTRTLTLTAPFSGIVLDKRVVEGQQVTTGSVLYRLADLQEVWVEGEVFEQDLAFVRVGSRGHFELAAYPGEHLMGRVDFVYPTVNPETRTARVRLTATNPGYRLRPGMYATLYFDVPVGGHVLTVPREAVVVTGERNLVFVRDTAGMLTPRQVVLGTRSEDRVQILSGLVEGERVVASANFLVDAESRLASTGGGMPGMQHGGATPAPSGGRAPAAPAPGAAMPPMPGMTPDSGPPAPQPIEHRHD